MKISDDLKLEVFKRDKFTCQYCGFRVTDFWSWYCDKLQVDHINPKGGDDMENLATTCVGCNSFKGSHPCENKEQAREYVLGRIKSYHFNNYKKDYNPKTEESIELIEAELENRIKEYILKN